MVSENITGALTRQAVREWMQISCKSIDYVAACIGVDTTTLRLWLNNPARNGIDHLVTAFIETTPPEQFKPTASSLRQPTNRDSTHKWCSRCGFTLPLAQFSLKADGSPRTWCRDCTNETYRAEYGSRTGATQ